MNVLLTAVADPLPSHSTEAVLLFCCLFQNAKRILDIEIMESMLVEGGQDEIDAILYLLRRITSHNAHEKAGKEGQPGSVREFSHVLLVFDIVSQAESIDQESIDVLLADEDSSFSHLLHHLERISLSS